MTLSNLIYSMLVITGVVVGITVRKENERQKLLEKVRFQETAERLENESYRARLLKRIESGQNVSRAEFGCFFPASNDNNQFLIVLRRMGKTATEAAQSLELINEYLNVQLSTNIVTATN